VVEPRPLGTAGGIRHAARGRVSETFLALNGDILADAPLAELIAAHRARGAVASIALTPVDDPSRYGLVRTAADGEVLGFLEKPSPEEIDTDLINAGAYVLEPRVLDLIGDRPVSIERETFPGLVGAGLFAFAQGGYWSDVGTPESYIAAHHDLLGGRIHSELPGLRSGACWVDEGARVSPGAVTEAPCHVAGGAAVAAGALIGAGSSVAADAQIAADAQLRGSVVQERARVGERAVIGAAVIGPRAVIGAGAQIEDSAVIGPDVSIPAGARVARGERVFPEGAR
jgi:mannose-1-phosphate guanylyltransferase